MQNIDANGKAFDIDTAPGHTPIKCSKCETTRGIAAMYVSPGYELVCRNHI
jgi:hypothetical protein